MNKIIENKNNLIQRSLLTLIVLVLALSISGCSGGFFKGNSEQGIETYEFDKGTDALSIQFIEGMPPKQLFIGTDFSTGIKIKNLGAFDVAEGAEIKISVPDSSAFQFKESNTKPFALRGKSLYLKEGDENVFIFSMKALCFPGYSEKIVTNYTRKIKASACYYYETAANEDICIDTRKFMRTKDEKPECIMREVKLSGGQAGPVGVTTISPTIIPQSMEEVKVQVSISIDKLKGVDHNIFSPAQGCGAPESINRVPIEVSLGGEPMDCRPGEILLKENSAVGTICEKTVSSDLGAFLSPLTVKMIYYVQQIQLKDLTVEPPPLEYGQVLDCAALIRSGDSVVVPQ